jgi:PKD repeat protein
MKKILLSLCLMLAYQTQQVFAQTEKSHFDNKPYVEGEMLVQIDEKVSLKGLLLNLPNEYEASIIEEVSNPMRIWLIKFNHHAISHENFQKLLYKQAGISVVDYNYRIEFRATVPNDAQFTQQWHHVNTGQNGGTVDADIDSDLAWDITTGGTTATNDDVVVCVIESANLTHTDLVDNAWFNTAEIPGNGIDDDGNGYIDDYRGWNPAGNNDVIGTGAHGTNCAGMIGAKGNNGTGVAGANWDVKIMVVTVGNLTQANVIASYTYPLVQRKRWNATNGAEGAFVVATSSSWGIDNANAANYPLWCNFYDTLGKYGIISVGATTNNTSNVDNNGDMPTTCASQFMVGVGRTDRNDNTAGGFGVINVDLGAPGIDVRTTANTNTYTTTTGTSFSCPLTAGVIGLAYSIPCPNFMQIVKANPQTGAELVLNALYNGVDVKSQLATRFRTSGRLNSFNTLTLLMEETCEGSFCSAPTSIQTTSISDVDATASWTPFAEAQQTKLFFREVGELTWNEITPGSNSFTFSGLNPCSSYEYYLQSICEEGESSPTNTFTFNTTGCGNCVDLPYCTNAATDAVDEWIASVQIGTWSNVSGNNNGYGNFTEGGAAPLSLQMGESYNLTLNPAWGGTQYNKQFKVWIDLNQNGTFEADEALYTEATANQLPATGSLSIPVSATAGSTRMRIQMAYIGGTTTFPNVCGTFVYGEVEDYCVEILSNEICGFTAVNTVTQPTCLGISNGSIAVTVSGGTPDYTYSWSGGQSTASLENLDAGNYVLTVTDQTGCDTTMSFVLSYQNILSASVSTSNPSCNGGNDGSATAVVTGGNTYTYLWSNGGTTATLENLTFGTYSVTVTDDQGCTTQASGNLSNPAAHQASFTTTSNDLTVTTNNTSTSGTYSWDFGDGTTSTETNPTHTYNDPGNYTICLTLTTSCGTFNTCNTVNILSVSSIEEAVVISSVVYPNPAENTLFVQVNSSRAHAIKVLDISGKELLKQTISSELTEISVADLATGMYLVHVLDEAQKTLTINRFVVKK